MVGRSAKVAENDRVRKKRELEGLLARDKELDMLFERLYEDNVSGKIDDARFAKMSKRYEQEQGENAGRIKTLRLELKKLEDKRKNTHSGRRKYRQPSNLTFFRHPEYHTARQRPVDFKERSRLPNSLQKVQLRMKRTCSLNEQ